MSWRPRSRRLAMLGVLGLCVVGSLGSARVLKRLDLNKPRPDLAERPVWPVRPERPRPVESPVSGR